ncbi:phospholipase D-like domain-containing protein [Paraliomyxa miuraensis]|uniref:phospholipase D-like domain-containing protein n=1 Tax=Paraliomyxa miuraensis TaxID=376150 RepID=UPI00224E95E8|nr:phospholipase D-like domain-containing protein [Paraliomyxa miuraensis]MCX4245201.1 phospholipase D-like domain-containing protein [Paraliomyxa miuraensis]
MIAVPSLDLRPARVRLVQDREHHELVVEAVRRAARSVWIATANLKELRVPGRRNGRYVPVLDVFDQLARDGVELRILHASLPSRAFRAAFDARPRLVAGGLRLRQCARVHMKAVIIDGALLYLGSANWTGAGLGAKGDDRRNFELGIVTDDDAMLDAVQERFDALWRGRACRTCRLRNECEAPLDLDARPPARGPLVRLRPPT